MPVRSSALTQALQSSSTPTAGEVLGDGTLIDLVGSPSPSTRLALIVRRGRRSIIGRRLLVDGSYYVAADLPPTLLESMYPPERAERYGSARSLFGGLTAAFGRLCPLAARGAQLSAYFAMATSFADCFPTAPCLGVVARDATSAVQYQRVLGAVSRHALPLADLQPSAFGRLPRGLRPTLILSQSLLASGTVRALRASQYRGFGVLDVAGISDLCCAKAIVIDEAAPDDLIPVVNLEIYLEPDRTPPVVSETELRALAAEFQPRLLDYRLKNHSLVRSSTFDVNEFDGATRETARALGACIVGDPELQQGVVEALKGQDEARRGTQWTTPSSLVVEALLALCHEPDRTSIYVGDITEVANGILAARKETVRLSPRKVGDLLRALSVTSSTGRNSNGYSFPLLNDNRRRIHELARGFRLLWMRETAGRCEYCAAVLGASD